MCSEYLLHSLSLFYGRVPVLTEQEEILETANIQTVQMAESSRRSLNGYYCHHQTLQKHFAKFGIKFLLSGARGKQELASIVFFTSATLMP